MKLQLCESWGDKEFCEQYEATWEISTDEVHYGWLAPGENALRLLRDVQLKGAHVLDAGCGMGQNLIALAKQGAIGYGIDLSTHMLDKASEIITQKGSPLKIQLAHDDMRRLSAFRNVEFDLILSIYSLEYVASIQEFRRTIHRFYQRLKPGGTLVVCFSHPSQIRRHHTLVNASLPIGSGVSPTYNFSFQDVITTFGKTGFELQRIVEQSTLNPSSMSYDEGRNYPYHFKHNQNPCDPRFDEISNHSPHTIIYKGRKPNIPTFGFPKTIEFGLGQKKIWGINRTIIKRSPIYFNNRKYTAEFFARLDNVVGICDVITISVAKDQMSLNNKVINVRPINDERDTEISAHTMLGIIHQGLLARGLQPVYRVHWIKSEEGLVQKGVLLESIIGLDSLVLDVFRGCALGILAFLDGVEPCDGELALDSLVVEPGRVITVSLLALRERRKFTSPQLPLL